MLPKMEGTIRLRNHIPAVAAIMPTIFGGPVEIWLNKWTHNNPRTPSSTSAIPGMTASIQKNNADIKKPSTRGISTFIHFNKNKYCAVKIATRKMDIPKTMSFLPDDRLFCTLPNMENLFNHFTRDKAGSHFS
jgi:hypothetical protein